LHCRKAHKEVIEILKSQDNGQKSAVPASPAGGKGQWTPFGVIHCFTGSKTQAKEYMDLGFHIGLNGIIFKINLGKEIREIPLGRILLETDCPFLTPPPEKGRNEPIFTKRIAKEVARVKGVSVEEVERVTTESARKLFRIQQ